MPILKEVGKWMRGWRLDKFFKKLFSNLRKESKVLLPIVVSVVDKINKAIQSKAVDAANDIIKGDWDDKIVEKLRIGLPKLALKLKFYQNIVDIEDPIEQFNAFLATITFSSDEERDAFLHNIGALILQLISDGDFSWGDAVVVLELFYQYEHKQAA